MKYTHKGPDRATMQIQQCNKVLEFWDGQYIAATEACWCLFQFPIHNQKPTIISLQVYLLGQHMVTFEPNPNDSVESIAAHAWDKCTMLTTLFELNRTDIEAHQYTYQELPQHYVWDINKKKWKCWQ